MNNYDEDYIKTVVRSTLKENNDYQDYYYLQNKVYVINALEDDEKIEEILKKADFLYPQQVKEYFRKPISDFTKDTEKLYEEQKQKSKVKEAKKLLEVNLDNLVYDEIKYDEFYSKYVKLVDEDSRKYTKSVLLTKEELDNLKYYLSFDEISEVLNNNKYKLELIFDENNNGFIGIVKK